MSTFIVAEDDFVISLFFETVLQELGHQVLGTVDTGEASLEYARRCPADCVLMDIGLSGQLTGVEAALELRTELGIPVIFVTGNSDIIERDPQIQSIRPLAVWIKPIDDSYIEQELQRLFPRPRRSS